MNVRCSRPEMAAALAALPDEGLVFVTDGKTGDEWPQVLAELTEAFDLAREAVRAGQPMVFVVDNDDLLGRNGPGRAMVATGLLSAARTAALEQIKSGVACNVIAVDDSVDLAVLADWCLRVTEPGGPTGQLVHLGNAHLGKTLA